MHLLSGIIASEYYQKQIKEKSQFLFLKTQKKPHLGIVMVGEDSSTKVYVDNKIKMANHLNIDVTLKSFNKEITESKLLNEINDLNKNPIIDGFIVQLPLPIHISQSKITYSISPYKDVDGFHPQNMGHMIMNEPKFIPATPKGIKMLLDYYNITTENKHIVIIGRSSIVGRPLSVLLSQKSTGNATVTLCHSATNNLSFFTRQADILVVATGHPNLINKEMIKDGAVIIDVGITKIKDDFSNKGWKWVGDVDFESVKMFVSAITPVPGGVGPMTVIALLSNLLQAAELSTQKLVVKHEI